MELMTPHVGTIFWTAVTFVAILALLYKYGWNPILALLEERERRIKESLETADRLQQQAKENDEERRRIIESARKEAHDLMIAGRLAAEKIRDEILVKAQAEANAGLERAKREIEASREQALSDIRTLAVELSMAATEKLIAKSLTVDDHRRMIDESLTQLEQMN